MKSKINILFIIIGVLFFFFMYFTSIQIVINSDSFFKRFFDNYDIYEKKSVSVDDSVYVIDVVVDYMEGKNNVLNLEKSILGFDKFSYIETLHMVDVKKIYSTFKWLRNIVCGLYVISFIIYIKKKKNTNLFKQSIISFFLANSFFCGIAVIVVCNFNQFWTMFHKILFKNDLWLLDFSTDSIINVCNNEMFKTIIFTSFGLCLILEAVYLVCIYIYSKRMLTKNT